MSEETVTMWSAEGAVTKGKVIELAGEMIAARYGGYKYFRVPGYGHLVIGTDVFDSEQAAIAAAKVKVAKRIASLEKSLAKARKNPFAPTEPSA